jgi:ATP-dependent DNA ligase
VTPVLPMPLLRVAEPFDDEDFVYEWKIDGFRGLALIESGECRLVSRNGYTFTRWNPL